ncbi:cutinase-domain-containing protein [Bisporella sp. PMI_857]|nr:cutinase-domain-containing protein [Bisporella sp. PMI_857]
MKIQRSIIPLLPLSALCRTSLAAPLAAAAADDKTSIGDWLSKIADGVSMQIYNSPKLDGTVKSISNFLAISTDALNKLGLVGPREENRKPGQCAPVIVVFVRGTSEAPNVGTMVGPPAFKSIRKVIGEKNLVVQGVKWEALLSTYQLGGDPKGIDDMVAQVKSAVKDCVKGKKDDSKIIMAGFSQGALMTRAAIKKLPTDVVKSVSGVVLWGDPAKRKDPNVQAPLELDKGNFPSDKVKVICHPLDAFCHNSDLTTPFHYVYFHWGRDEAVNFILQKTGFGTKKVRTLSYPRDPRIQ